jgi:hypothetical protein
MSDAPTQPEPAATIDLLRRWLARTVTPEAVAWLDAEIDRQRTGVDERRLGLTLGLVGRKIGRTELSLTPDDVAAARRHRAHWQPEFWASDEGARLAMLLATHHDDDQTFAARVDRLCATAEVTEHVAYLKGFAVFPAAKQLHGRAREGVRSSIGPIFEAIACRNPYPFDHFDDAAWNQMVVKCVFTGASIETIVGLRERRNPELIQMLRDFVAERHAAGRPLPDAVYNYIGGE